MAIELVCPACGYQGRVPNEYLGRKVRCRQCNSYFPAVPASESRSDMADTVFNEDEKKAEKGKDTKKSK